MLAKGRLLGIQFYTLLKDHLYEDIGRHENKMADYIREAFKAKGYPLYLPSKTNQVFVDLPLDVLAQIEEHYLVTHIQPLDNQQMRVRLVTSWATPKVEVEKFVEFIKQL